MPWCLALLLAAAAGRPAVVDSGVPPSVNWVATVQAGVGRLGEDAALLVKPRLAYAGDRSELVIAAPLWLEIADLPPRSAGHAKARNPRWLSAWDDPETYAGILERLAWVSSTGALRVAAGRLSQETLGRALLVDHFQGTLDPTRPRTGGRADLELGLFRVTALADSFVRPNLIAGRVSVPPLALAGRDPDTRLKLGLEVAGDPRAPTSSGSRPVTGGAFDASVAVWRGAGVTVDSFVAAAWLGGWGAQAGGAAAWASDHGHHALTLEVAFVGAGEGHQPGYFDGAYSVERYAGLSGSHAARAERRLPAALGWRGTLDGRLGPARFGMTVVARESGGQETAAAYLRIVQPRWSAAATLMQRSVTKARDLVALDQSTYAMVEGALLVWRGLFVFSQLRHGPRRDPGGLPRPEADWLLGVGWGAADG